MYWELYNLFFSKCAGIHHHSQKSLELVCNKYPIAETKKHIVTSFFIFESHHRENINRREIRSRFGYNDDHFIILVFGSLRSWEEAHLLKKAFSLALVKNKRLLLATRFSPGGSMWSRTRQRLVWSAWLRMNRIISYGFIPDEDLYKYFESADVVIIPRLDTLNSGVIGMAMTFGTVIIAPEIGSFPDQLSQTGNLLYQPGCASSLATALKMASEIDANKVRKQNKGIGKSWSLDRIVRECIALATG